MEPKTIAIIQARMSSSRLPNKVLLDIAGQPALAHVVERTRRAKTIDQVVVATTTDPSDDPIESLCAEGNYLCYRGNQHDVLDRYYKAAQVYAAEVIVRITGDCPLIDPDVIDKTISAFWGGSDEKLNIHRDGGLEINKNREGAAQPSSLVVPYDFVANRLPPPWGRTYPIGLDTEVCAFTGLELAWKEAKQPRQREHVMPFFYEQPERFRILLVNHDTDYGTLRWTLDTPDDLELLRQVFAHFQDRNDFSWLEVLALFEQDPQLGLINAHVQAKHYQAVDDRQ
jgi:spore coat polysaccharide biosynthesis protein SpsF